MDKALKAIKFAMAVGSAVATIIAAIEGFRRSDGGNA